ncbi:MAG: DUF1189 family protein [Acholeplasmataceae bacterium]
MFLVEYFKRGFQFSKIFEKPLIFNYKIIIYFILLSLLSAFPLNYQIISEDGFRLDFIAQDFQNAIPDITIPYTEVSMAGVVSDEDYTFVHEGIHYYVNVLGSYDQDYETPAVILNRDLIIYDDGDNSLESQGYQGFSDLMLLHRVNYGSEEDNILLWETFGASIEGSFSAYIIVYTMATNIMVQLFIQAVFVVFLMFVLRLFKYGLSTFMTYQESVVFIILMMTMPAVVSAFVAFIEPVFANVIYQLLVGVTIMIVMLKFGRKHYQ